MDENARRVMESADMNTQWAISQFDSRVHTLELMVKSLDHTLTTLANETAQRPGAFRQELERLESRMMWRMRAMSLVIGVAAVVVLWLISL